MSELRRGMLALSLCCVAMACTGPKGDKGDPGEQGVQGPAGPIGPTGMDGAAGPTGPTGPAGATGATGAAGADGQLRIYGNGSAGSVTITTATSWVAGGPPNQNLQFADLTINAGATLTVPSGTVLRISGSFSNAGTINVATYVEGGFVDIDASGGGDMSYAPPGQGFSRHAAASGERLVGGGTILQAGLGGIGVGSAMIAASLLSPGPAGGGGGAPTLTGTGGNGNGFGSAGGGTLVVLASGAITNSGTINANGESVAAAIGSGGGGGGLVVLASPVSVTNSGTINATGGTGGGSGVSFGPGGGGGGGIVHLIAPVVTAGTITVTGGAAGTPGAVGSVTGTASRMGGGGGGGSGGSGGSGGGVSGANPLAAGAGLTGLSLVRRVDPTALF